MALHIFGVLPSSSTGGRHKVSHRRPDNPEHKLVFALPLFLALGLFAGSNGQDFLLTIFVVGLVQKVGVTPPPPGP